MIDTLDYIESRAAAGYAWLAKALPLLQQEGWLILALLLVGSVWAIVRTLPEAVEDQTAPLWGIAKYWVSALIGVFLLYVPVSFQLRDIAPRLDATIATRLGGVGSMLIPSWGTELLARDAVTVALRISNPDRQQLVQVPAAQLAASKVVESALAVSDPQLNANRRIWQEVIAPAYLDGATPALRDELRSAGVLAAFLNPVSDMHANSDASTQAAAVRAIIDRHSTPPLLDMVASLQPLINERLGGASSWTLQPSSVAVLPITDVTLNGAASPPAAPVEVTSRADASEAYDRGRRILTGVVNDPQRRSAGQFSSLGELYTALGRSNDVVAAANVLRDPMSTMWFGATCQRDQALCTRSLVDAQAAQDVESRGGSSSSVLSEIASLGGFVATLAGRLIANVLESIISAVMPASIGYVKAMVVLLAPVAALLMLWPGRFTLALYLTIGAHTFIALWTIFYIIWDRFTGSQLNVVSGVQSLFTNFTPSSMLAANLGQLLIVAGYFGLTALAFGIAMSATTALGRAAVGATGAGLSRFQKGTDSASNGATRWGFQKMTPGMTGGKTGR